MKRFRPIFSIPVVYRNLFHPLKQSNLSVSVSGSEIAFGSDVVITVSINSEATGYLDIYINEDEYYERRSLTESTIFTVSNLDIGYKEVTIKYSGDSDFYNATVNSSFSVVKPLVSNFTMRYIKKTYPNDYQTMTQLPQEAVSYLSSIRPDRLVGLLEDCKALTSVDLNSIDTSACINLRYLVYGCKALTSIDLSGLDTSNVQFMESLFQGSNNLQVIDLSGWISQSVVASDAMEYMFASCTSLQYIIIDGPFFNMIDSSRGSLNSTCKILVPQSLLSTYQTASNWSSIASRIEAVENYTITRSNGQVSVVYNSQNVSYTINYLSSADNSQLFEPYTGTCVSGTQIDLSVPTQIGWTADRARIVETIINDNTVINVYYTENVYTLTIQYVYITGGTAYPSYIHDYPYGAQYSISSPEISGYTADSLVVNSPSDGMPARPITVIVNYSANGPIIDDGDIPIE